MADRELSPWRRRMVELLDGLGFQGEPPYPLWAHEEPDGLALRPAPGTGLRRQRCADDVTKSELDPTMTLVAGE
jgi:hypothetical protein